MKIQLSAALALIAASLSLQAIAGTPEKGHTGAAKSPAGSVAAPAKKVTVSTAPAVKTRPGAVTHSAIAGSSSTTHGSTLTWTSVDEGFALGKKQHKPILVDFYTDWCGWCKVLDARTFSAASMKPLLSKFVLVKANAEDGGQGQRLATSLGVNSFPTTVLFDPSGKPKASKQGFAPPETFGPVLQDFLAGKPVK